MSRFRAGAEERTEESIDISPLIDCVFILLIFFIVTTTFVEETGVDVERPRAASAEQLEKTSIIFAVTDKGEVVYGGREIGLSGVRPQVKRLLQDDPSIPVIIQADAGAPSGTVVRLVDEVKLANAEKVSIAAKRPAS